MSTPPDDPPAEARVLPRRWLAWVWVVPIGAAAEVRNGRLHLDAIVANPDGTKILRESRDGDDPEKLGSEVGETLLRRGGDAILEEVYGQGLAVPEQP